jgi:hypothetical protein
MFIRVFDGSDESETRIDMVKKPKIDNRYLPRESLLFSKYIVYTILFHHRTSLYDFFKVFFLLSSLLSLMFSSIPQMERYIIIRYLFQVSEDTRNISSSSSPFRETIQTSHPACCQSWYRRFISSCG